MDNNRRGFLSDDFYDDKNNSSTEEEEVIKPSVADQPESNADEDDSVNIYSSSSMLKSDDPSVRSDDSASGSDDPLSNIDDYDEFQPIDVSEPRAPIREMDIIEEALAIRRRDWIKNHLSYIYAGIGVVLVAVIVFVIYMYFQGNNPMSRFSGSLSKNFSTSFNYDVKVSEDNVTMMKFDGAIEADRSKHFVKSSYQADYNRYSYLGAVYGDDKSAVKGSYYNNKWTTHDCTDDAQDFFDFDRDFRAGGFDSGSFLRFTGLTSDYSTREMDKMAGLIKSRLSTDSPIAMITTEKTEDGTHYHYDINVYEVFELIKENGASVFYRASDYDKFVASFEANKKTIETAECTIDFTVNNAGYMTDLDAAVVSEGRKYAISCVMSDFGEAQVEMPESFLRAAEIVLPEE